MDNAITWESIDQGTRLSIRDLARSTIETIRRLLSIGRDRADTGTATRVLIEIAIDEMIRTGASEEQVLDMLAQALHGAQGRSSTAERASQATASDDAQAPTAASATERSISTEQDGAAAAKGSADNVVSGTTGGMQPASLDEIAWGGDGSSARGDQSWETESRGKSKSNIEVASGARPGYPYRIQLISPEGDVVKVLSVRGGEQGHH